MCCKTAKPDLLNVYCDKPNATVSTFCTGVGGQMDFIRGAALGIDGLGKPIIAIPSVSAGGESKIVPY